MSSLRLYNTLTRTKEVFVPLVPKEVRMYVCGMTVYDYCHMGHARVMVVFDIVQRWLRASGYRVTYVRNITDIDDKIIRRAQENGEPVFALTERFIRAMHEDADALGVLRPDSEPRATEFVPQMLEMIEALEKNGYVYQSDSGDVNYAVRKFVGYGKLSGKSLDNLRAGARVAVSESKHDPLDFVLWKPVPKPASENNLESSTRAHSTQEATPSWPSKWGEGRPGWHIECSAMSRALLGSHFDIHGGGQDLQFPHHENEIAQSEGACSKPAELGEHKPFVNYWLHNGYVQIDNEKMSKSLNNFATIRAVLEQFDAEVVRFFILRAHYRSPLNYSTTHLEDARQALTRLYTALKKVPADEQEVEWSEPYAQRFSAALNDDFNTPLAVAVLFDLATVINTHADAVLARQLKGLAKVLGLLERSPSDFLQHDPAQASRQIHAQAEHAALHSLSVEDIEARIRQRSEARKARRFQEADAIRDALLKAGIVLEDAPDGRCEWRRA